MSTHTPLEPVKPRLHVHAATLAALASELEYCGQATAVAFVEPCGQKNPAWQPPLQLLELCPGELPKRPAGHCAQVLEAVAEE